MECLADIILGAEDAEKKHGLALVEKLRGETWDPFRIELEALRRKEIDGILARHRAELNRITRKWIDLMHDEKTAVMPKERVDVLRARLTAARVAMAEKAKSVYSLEIAAANRKFDEIAGLNREKRDILI